MIFDPPLIEATLLRRYKRFLADVRMADGSETTVAVPNTGSMMGLTAGGSRALLSRSANPARKYPHTLEAVEADGALVGINTGIANRIAEEAIAGGLAGDLATYGTVRREQKYGANSRIDFLLERDGRPPCFVEVKNVTLSRSSGLSEFPDSVTARGAKHLEELSAMVRQGARAVMLYLVQRPDCDRFRLADDLDPAYASAYRAARAAGVEAVAIGCHISSTGIEAQRAVALTGNAA